MPVPHPHESTNDRRPDTAPRDTTDTARLVPEWRPLNARSAADVSEQTLQDILDAAGRLFARFGVERVSVSDVARDAGVSKATIYRYVQSKPSLVHLYAIREGRRIVSSAITRRWRDDLDLVGLACFAAGFLDDIRTHPVGAKVLADEPEIIHGILAQTATELDAQVRFVITLMSPLLAARGFTEPQLAIEALLRMFASLLLLAPVSVHDAGLGSDPTSGEERPVPPEALFLLPILEAYAPTALARRPPAPTSAANRAPSARPRRHRSSGGDTH